MGQAVGREATVGSHHYRIKKQIAEGGFSYVFLCNDVATGDVAVLKRMRVPSDSDDMVRLVTEEVQLLANLPPHPNIVRYLDAQQINEQGFLCVDIAMEYCSGGSLFDVLNALHKAGKLMPEETCLRYFYGCVQAVAHLHAQKPPIAHRDIKVENFLLHADGTVKLCDFGSCTRWSGKLISPADIAREEEAVEKYTTPAYRAPELVDLYSRNLIDERVDIWALGVMLFKLAYMVTPFEDNMGIVQKMAILNNRYTLPKGLEDTYSPAFQELIASMLKAKPQARPTAAELVTRVAAMVPTLPPPLVSPAPGPAPAAGLGRRLSFGGNANLSSPVPPPAPAPAPAPALAPGAAAAPAGASTTRDPMFGEIAGEFVSQAGPAAAPGFEEVHDNLPVGTESQAAAGQAGGGRLGQVRNMVESFGVAAPAFLGRAATAATTQARKAATTSAQAVPDLTGHSLSATVEAVTTRVLQVVQAHRLRWIIKATSQEPSAPKNKYVRRILIDALERDTFQPFVGPLEQRLAHHHPMVFFKACILLFRVLHASNGTIVAQLAEFIPTIAAARDQWGSAPRDASTPAAHFIDCACAFSSLLSARIQFHCAEPQYNGELRTFADAYALGAISTRVISRLLSLLLELDALQRRLLHDVTAVFADHSTAGKLVLEPAAECIMAAVLVLVLEASMELNACLSTGQYLSPDLREQLVSCLAHTSEFYTKTMQLRQISHALAPLDELPRLPSIDFVGLDPGPQPASVRALVSPATEPTPGREGGAAAGAAAPDDDSDSGEEDGTPAQTPVATPDRKPSLFAGLWGRGGDTSQKPSPAGGTPGKRPSVTNAPAVHSEAAAAAPAPAPKPSSAPSRVDSLGLNWESSGGFSQPAAGSPAPAPASASPWGAFDPFGASAAPPQPPAAGGGGFGTFDPFGSAPTPAPAPVPAPAVVPPALPAAKRSNSIVQEQADVGSPGLARRGSGLVREASASKIQSPGLVREPSGGNLRAPGLVREPSDSTMPTNVFRIATDPTEADFWAARGPGGAAAAAPAAAHEASPAAVLAAAAGFDAAGFPPADVVVGRMRSPSRIEPESMPAEAIIPLNQLHLEHLVGSGGSADVFRASFRGIAVAVKRLKQQEGPEQMREWTAFLKEIDMLRSLSHPNIVQFVGVVLEPPSLVTEFCSRGCLFAMLHDMSIALPWSLRLQMALDAAQGMTYLHSRGVMHRDLKSLNLLVAGDWTLKVGDFGLSRFKPTSDANFLTSQCGTWQWMAPEVVSGMGYDEKVDVYSFGINLWELATRQVPYNGMPPMQVGMAVVTKGLRPLIPEDCPAEYAALIAACWQTDSASRPPFSEIVTKLQHLRSAAVSSAIDDETSPDPTISIMPFGQ